MYGQILQTKDHKTRQCRPGTGLMNAYLSGLDIGDCITAFGPQGRVEYLGRGQFSLFFKEHNMLFSKRAREVSCFVDVSIIIISKV